MPKRQKQTIETGGNAQGAQSWHAMTVHDVCGALQTTTEGLSSLDCRARLDRYGPNRLPEKSGDNILQIYIRQFASPLIYLLLAASAVSFVNAQYTDAAFIFGVLQINALIGTMQEWKAGRSAQALQDMTRTMALVRRDGRRQEIESEGLVPGDLVEVASGDMVPADLRMLESTQAGADESLLTGESTPVDKSGDMVLPDATVSADRRNMVFAGTKIMDGRAIGIVTGTGAVTEIGRIARVIESGAGEPPLLRKLRLLARHITILMSVAIAALAIVLLLRGAPMSEVFLVAVALAVAAIPEGLPVAITVALSVAVSRMAARQVIVRSLPAVEGLGACTVIACDKTGTLTRNRLAVAKVLLSGSGGVLIDVDTTSPHGGVSCAGSVPPESAMQKLQRLAWTGAICNEASLYIEGGEERRVGDTVDIAFLALARRLDMLPAATENRHNLEGRIDYEPGLGFAAVVEAGSKDGGTIAHVKGAGEVLLPMCRLKPEDADTLEMAEALAGQGYKVIALAGGAIEPSEQGKLSQSDLHDLELLGFVGLFDPLRPEVPEAIAQCRSSGVDVRMVTGDHPATALTVARELGLAEENDEAVTGEDLARFTSGLDVSKDRLPPGLVDILTRTRVFARIDPIQKLVIVELLKRMGHFVAVTGDGVNDAPALNAAEIGIAMAHTGTDVAREAASLLLLDDNFTSIAGGIKQGRIAYDNIRKVTLLLIATGIGEIVLFVLALVAGLPIPLLAVQLLWLNLVTNGIQHVALAFERGEPGIMERRPRPPDQALFNVTMVTQVSLSGTYIGFAGFAFYSWALAEGYEESQARTALLFLMVLFENVHVFNCRSERRSAFKMPFVANPFVAISVFLALSLHAGATYTSGLGSILHVEAMELELLLLMVPIALGLLLVMETYKWATGRRNAALQG
jgi:magnesium-transporting ATPase (P-type)